jgi:4-amino-4-deoxy-L-arabinose transferase-like glycosyltransferase
MSPEETEAHSERRLILLLSVLLLVLPLALYEHRGLDDNRLTSWRWVFGIVEARLLLPFLAGALLLSFWGSRFRSPGPFLLTLLAAVAGVGFWSTPESIVDASRYFTQAKHLALHGPGYFLREWGGAIGAWTDLPAVPFLQGLLFGLLGESRIVIQGMTTGMFALTVLVLHRMGRDLWGEQEGVAAGAFLLAVPYVLTQVPLMLVDVPAMFFLTLSAYAFLAVLRRGGAARLALAGVALGVTVLSKYSLWLMLSELAVVGVVVLWLEVGRRALVFRRAIAALALGALLPGAFFLLKHRFIMEQMSFLMEYQRPGLDRWTESFLSTFCFQLHPVLAIAAVGGLLVAIGRRDVRILVACWLPLLLMAMGVRRIRYLLPAFPMIALMAGYGLASFGGQRSRSFVLLATVLTSWVLAFGAFLPYLKQNELMNLKLAGQYLDTLPVDTVEVHTLPQKSKVNPAVAVPILDLHTTKRLVYAYEPRSHLSAGQIARSSLRFTWRYRNPAYYEPSDEAEPAVVAVIAPGPADALSARLSGHRMARRFERSSGIFRFRPFVSVYLKND